MSEYRKPSQLVRENTEPKPKIHEERQERAAELKAEQEAREHGPVDEKIDE